MHDRFTDPNYELIAYLKQARLEELIGEGGIPTGTITVSLDFDESEASVREEWLSEIDDEQRTWLTAFAGVCSVLRYAAYFPALEFSSTVRKITQGRASRVTDWTHGDEVNHEDVWFEVEILGSPTTTSPGGYLLMDVPKDFTEIQVLEPVAILRTYLLNHHDAAVVFACGLAFETLAAFAGQGKLHAVALDDQMALQIEMPTKIMRVLEGAERVAPFLSGADIEGEESC